MYRLLVDRIFCSLMVIVLLATGLSAGIIDATQETTDEQDTEYWALIIGVGEYADNTGEDRPLMLEEVDDFKECLLESSWWTEDHIKTIKAEEGTVSNIVDGMKWLDSVEDADDVCVVYLTTHGFPLVNPFNQEYIDLPPKDEDDGADEAAMSYWGFEYDLSVLTDDRLNMLLNRLESDAVCLFVDTCYAGGFDDHFDSGIASISAPIAEDIREQMKISWMDGFAEDVRAQGRVIVMASREDEPSYSGGFAPYMIDGLRGHADTDADGMVSAEETFLYAEPRSNDRQHPTIYDDYDGELELVEVSAQMYPDEVTVSAYSTSLQCDDVLSDDATLCGYVSDAVTEESIPYAELSLWGYSMESGQYELSISTDDTGFYSAMIPEGMVHIEVVIEGYLTATQRVRVDPGEFIWINLSVAPRGPDDATLCGYILEEESGLPIDDVEVELEGYIGESSFSNESSSDSSGFYSISLCGCEFEAEFDCDGYFKEEAEDVISSGETIWANMSLTAFPGQDAVICGYVTEHTSASPLQDVRLDLQWVDFESDHQYEKEVRTDDTGFYSAMMPPGEIYMSIRQSGYEYYDPYRHDTLEGTTRWVNISVEDEELRVQITHPLCATYVGDLRVIPSGNAILFGPMTVNASAYQSYYQGGAQLEYVEFYLDGQLKETATEDPFVWRWGGLAMGHHTISIVSEDANGRIDEDSIDVFRVF